MDNSTSKAGLTVRLRDNPGRQGVTTGQTRTVGGRLMAQVDFGPNEKAFKYAELLEPVAAEDDLMDLLAAARFGGPADLRRLLTLEKAKGNLTNVFYSMESSNTDFYPHQFKPVLKFIESSTRRLLIADEVGLGKTIEALYIWKELQAREDARRLLIVCPSMLRQKWRDDMASRFGIAAEIVDAGQLRQKLEDLTDRGIGNPFVCITSLEGLRPPPRYEEEDKKGNRVECARIMERNPARDDFALFDLAIIDEAHYLRNSGTAAQRLGKLLHDAARNLILLTATPIQIDSENLYRLLQLIDPVQFEDFTVFGDMLAANAPIVRAQRALWCVPMNIEAAHEAINDALKHFYFKGDSVLERIRQALPSDDTDIDQRVEILRMLESRSLLSQVMTRSRKREVLDRRVERSPQVASVNFSEREREVYRRVTARIRARASGMQGVSIFSLIARQRQMASSLPAALASWRDRGLLDDLLWEDVGSLASLNGDINIEDDPFNMEMLQGEDIDLAALEADDEKYKTLRNILLEHNSEKCVVFAFFRGTLHYLERRLKADGITCTAIMGDMGDLKQDALVRFRAPDGPQVLLSSEVGSEGIDLQFCRMLVNYDLPWNPMRVEQRIGRLDRLGQKADRISIINLKVEDTIEDRIVMRLYERIDLFRDSIGDLEEILGDTTEKLMLELLNPELTEDERNRLAEAAAVAVVNKRHEQNRLEQEAVNLLGFSDYILDSIRESRSHGRWLGGEELLEFVEDFFARKYPGAKIELDRKIPMLAKIRLPDDARASLEAFISESRPATRTRLHQSSIPLACMFDPRTTLASKDVERIDPTHPLIQWIRADYLHEARPLHPVAALKITTDEANLPPGYYVFVVHRWSFQGLKSDHVLAFRATLIGGDALTETISEGLVTIAARHGKAIPNAVAVLPDINAVTQASFYCEELLAEAFDKRMQDTESENALRCDQQKTSAEAFARRRLLDFHARIEKFQSSGKHNLIPMTEGLIRKEQQQLQIKLDRINKRRSVDSELTPLATGIIQVE